MKKSFTFLAALSISILSLTAADKEKKGFGFGVLPAISYDSDLGFQYGALVNLYDYGDGSSYPKYNHSLYMEWSRYTKGTGINRLMYDSEKLIHKVRTTVDVTYLTDQMMDFYGYNGYQTNFDKALSDSTRYFYKNERNMFRIKADFQGNFGKSAIGWVAGYTFYDFKFSNVNLNKLGFKTIEGGSLYQRYIDYKLIPDKEKNGGSINYIKLGLKFDSRDQRACPMKGIWTEAVFQLAPGIINSSPHAKFAFIHRQYFTLDNDMSFAYRIDYQATIGNGRVPFYAQPLLITSFLTAASNQGIGGKSTVRGVLRNRVVGDDVAFGNFEYRYKFIRFQWLKQNFYLGANAFFDTGVILKPIDINYGRREAGLGEPTNAEKTKLFLTDDDVSKFHSAAGAGLKIGWNENFVISADIGKSFNKQDGNTGFYIGLNYLF